MSAASVDPGAVFGAYEAFKRSFLNTEASCAEQGLKFLPFVVEAHGGGLAAGARRVCAFIAKSSAAQNADEVDSHSAELLRRITISVHRENARAVLRRLPGGTLSAPSADPSGWAVDPEP